MSFTARSAFMAILAMMAAAALAQQPADDALNPWLRNVNVHPVGREQPRHTIHTYYLTSPESPDGKWVLFYTSTQSDGHCGQIRIIDRATGEEKLLADNVNVEDAHRAACQQWISNGRRVAFHDVHDGKWLVACVDITTGEQRILARDHQTGFGSPAGDIVPVYGCHWNPGQHRGLDIVDAQTGQLRNVLAIDAIRKQYAAFFDKLFKDREISVFFPVLSPDRNRIFFKIASGNGGEDFRTAAASVRQGMIGYDLQHSQFLFSREKWGHPAWHPDSKTLIEVNTVLIDAGTGIGKHIPDLPNFPGSHPSVSPDGRLFVTDTTLEKFGGTSKEMGIVVASIRGGQYQIIHRFNNSHGATSWRKSHPHPAFSPDGKRIYFNVSSTEWTRLHVAEPGT